MFWKRRAPWNEKPDTRELEKNIWDLREKLDALYHLLNIAYDESREEAVYIAREVKDKCCK
jgi:hypothetical protein